MNKQQVPFGRHRVGSGLPVCIVFEAGATHTGLDSAKRLVDVAAEAGADAVKFQIIDVDRLVPDPATMFTYEALVDKNTGRSETVTESLQGILKRREMPAEDWRRLAEYCRAKNIEFFSTATCEEDLAFLHELGVGSVKIASGDISYHHLMRVAARYPWTIQIDTGSSSLGEVERAVDVLEESGCNGLIINHCPSGYPARLDGINLRILTTLQCMFPYPVAFSDHSPGATMDIAAVALGVSMIEKTITLDRCARSPEHIMSLEPEQCSDFVRTIRSVEQAMGLPRKTGGADRRFAVSVSRRSIRAKADIPAGSHITQELLEYARPGDGLSPDLDYLILQSKARRNILAGEPIRLEMLE